MRRHCQIYEQFLATGHATGTYGLSAIKPGRRTAPDGVIRRQDALN